MKIFLYVLMFLLSSQAYSHYPDKTPDGKDLVYCPHHVECTKERDYESCKVSDDKYKVWSTPYPEDQFSVSKGMYKFTKGDNYYGCIYTFYGPHVQNTIVVQLEDNSLFVPSLWSLEFSDWYWYNGHAICESENEHFCPWETSLQALRLSEDGTTTNFSFSINNINFGRSFTYNQLLDACGATSLCYVDIVSVKEIQGSLRVDTTTPDMINIVNISMAPESSCAFKRKEPFNTIYCDPNKEESKELK